MIKQHVALYPFTAVAAYSSQVTTTVDIMRCSNMLTLNFEIRGNLAGILIPGTAETRSRKNKLWEQTCFELFLAVGNSPSYREFNFSPDGNWNVYSFESYREGMKEEATLTDLPFSVRYEEGSALSCYIEIALNKIVQPDSRLEAAVSAVIKQKDGTLSYWAMTQGIGKPDFHRRDGFAIEL